jgi:alginate O-acetyltransferase complex protein AlgI
LTRNRYVCWFGIVLSVAALVFYKYTKFLCLQVLGTVAPSLSKGVVSHNPALMNLIPPLAISFFAFEFIHYLVDVSRGGKPIRSITDFTLYSIFWPSIVAGPVKRYQAFIPALHQGLREVGEKDVAVGLARVALGLIKKFTADNLTAFITYYGPQFLHLDAWWRWFFVLALAFRILLDFSGYSDMAIGFARIHGIRLPENFNWPYLARNISDFWRRWHISLSLWIRDYVYIALGGNRCGPVRKMLNGLIAFGLCGLWHGAGWNFLVWGLYHGAGLTIAGSYRTLLGRAGEEISDWFARHDQFAWALTMLFVAIGWLFFFYPLPVALAMAQRLFGG